MRCSPNKMANIDLAARGNVNSEERRPVVTIFKRFWWLWWDKDEYDVGLKIGMITCDEKWKQHFPLKVDKNTKISRETNISERIPNRGLWKVLCYIVSSSCHLKPNLATYEIFLPKSVKPPQTWYLSNVLHQHIFQNIEIYPRKMRNSQNFRLG